MRYLLLGLMFVFGLCTQVQAKVIIIASQGGKEVLYDLMPGSNYDPISEYSEYKPSQILMEHSFMPAVACLINRDSVEYVSAIISEKTPRVDPVVTWLLGEYDIGDKLFLLGYSAGCKFVIDVAREIQNAHVGIDKIDGMFLVDTVLFTTGYRDLPGNIQHLAVYYQRNGIDLRTDYNEWAMGRELFWGPGARYLPGYPKEITGVHHQNIDNSPFILYDVATKIKDITNIQNNTTGTDIRPAIFTIGNHTHVIAPSYRCSKEMGKSILCWESGLDPNEADGRRNCWNAWKWYQFHGEVSQVADHHNDSGWITNLSRDFTCNEVYNSGSSGTSTGGDLGGTSYGTGNGTGNGYHNDSGDPWSGYVHHVGLQYLKIGKKSSGHWKGSKVWALSQIPTKRDFRVKLKRKGDKWTDVCAEIWFSHNKYFTDDDLYLGKECKKLSKKKWSYRC